MLAMGRQYASGPVRGDRLGSGGATRIAAVLAVLVLALVAAGLPSRRADAAPPAVGSWPEQAVTTVPAASVAADLRAGRSVELDDTVIEGTLDLTGSPPVAGAFRCHACRLGGFVAPDVTFRRFVDLRGSQVDGSIDWRGATFEDPVSLAQLDDDHLTDVSGPVLAAQVTFGDRASFDGATFHGDADFGSARFQGVTLTSAKFVARLDLSGSTFAGRLDAVAALLGRGTDFTRADLRQGASLIGAVFAGEASFDFAQVSGGLDASNARFLGATSLEWLSLSGELGLGGARFDGPIYVSGFSPQHIVMDLSSIGRVDGADHQRLVLGLLETDARDRGDLGLANEAHFQHLRLNSHRLSWPGQMLDVVVYRFVLGYLVRPAYPARLLVLFVFVVATYRWAKVRRQRRRGLLRRGAHPISRLRPRQIRGSATEFLDQLQAAVGRALAPKVTGTAHGLGVVTAWGEYAGAKILLAGVLLGLANSNATLRQLVDAVR